MTEAREQRQRQPGAPSGNAGVEATGRARWAETRDAATGGMPVSADPRDKSGVTLPTPGYLARAIGCSDSACAQCAADREAVARALALGPSNELCDFRIERGSYFIGPCRLRFGHGGAHNPYAPGEMEADFERRFGFPPYVEVDLAGTNRTPIEAAGGHDDVTNRWADKREAGQ